MKYETITKELEDSKGSILMEQKKCERLRDQVSRTEKELYGLIQRKYELIGLGKGPSTSNRNNSNNNNNSNNSNSQSQSNNNNTNAPSSSSSSSSSSSIIARPVTTSSIISYMSILCSYINIFNYCTTTTTTNTRSRATRSRNNTNTTNTHNTTNNNNDITDSDVIVYNESSPLLQQYILTPEDKKRFVIQNTNNQENNS